MKAEELDEKFDNGEEILDQFDLESARRIQKESKRVNVDFPLWMVESLDFEATKVGVTRQSLIKLWLADRLKQSTGDN